MIREWVQQRWRELPLDQLRERVRSRLPRHSQPWSLFVVEGIDDVQVHGTPAASVRFVELYEGATSYERRQLRDPSQWPSIFDTLTRAADELRAAEHKRVLVRGAMRLPMWFATGAALRHVRGFTVAIEHNGQLWASEDASAPTPVQATIHPVGGGPDLAVVVSVATDASEAVLRYVDAANLPVANVIHVVSVAAPGGEAVRDGQHAATLAVSIRNAARSALLNSGATHIHLFLATPGGLALLLGHRWNALAPTTLYEHLGGAAYAQAMTVPA